MKMKFSLFRVEHNDKLVTVKFHFDACRDVLNDILPYKVGSVGRYLLDSLPNL